jgi:roadblock/LC7 domain-containing protein
MTDLQTAVARAQDHLQTVSDDLAIAHLAGDLSKCRAAVAAAMTTATTVAGDLAAIAALVPNATSKSILPERFFNAIQPAR